MNIFDTKELQKSVILYISLAMLTLLLSSIFTISFAHKQYIEEKEKEYKNKIDVNIQDAINYIIKHYYYRVRSLSETANIRSYILNNDRDGLYKVLYPMFKLMQEENSYLKIMHVHLADGRSFLRVHKPDDYGDNIAQTRAMIRNIHKSHKTTTGYETGRHDSVYRIISPIFDTNGTYIGAIEIGIEPTFLIEAIKNISDSFGVLFIKEDELKIFSSSDENEKFKKLYNQFKPIDFNDHKHYDIDGQDYMTHFIILKNFSDEDSVKIITFQKKDNIFSSFFYTYYLRYLLILSLFFVIVFMVIKQVRKYQESVEDIYNQQVDELTKSKTNLQDLFDTTPDILITINSKTIKNANKAMLEFFGYNTLEDFLSEHNCICDYFEEVYECLEESVHGLKWFEYIKQNNHKVHKVSMTKNGKKYFFDIKSKKLSYDTDNTHLVVFTDITEIELSRERYIFALNATNDGLWDLNLVNNELYLSNNWKKQLGYNPDELESSQEVWKELLHPDDKDKVINNFQSNIKGQTDTYECVYRLKHKDGHWVWILDRGKTLFDHNEIAIRAIGTHTDITKVKQLEKDLKGQKYIFELFMDHIPAYVVIKDIDQEYVYANLLSKHFFDNENHQIEGGENFFDEETINKIKSMDDIAYEKGKCEDILKIPKANIDRYYRVIKFSIKNNESKKRIATIAFDITEDYNNKLELKEQQNIMISQSRQAALGEMISMIAHQWRQPISIISMEASNMLADIEFDNLNNILSKEYANNIMYQTQELSHTIDDFRNFFKPVKIREKVKLENIFFNVMKIIGKSLENNSINVVMEIDNTIELYTYSRELMQVIINLIKNAKDSLVEHNKENPTIKILTKKEKNIITISICDNGSGIDEKNKEKIFEPYFSTKDQKDATGLGLYMSKTIIERHLNGKISANNTEKGICFCIIIPDDLD
ncbi:PAS domain-containing protein [Sulfurimonas sp.]|uniref:PAS domain-containing protein n=1 Tax=Sulfurimonas sp. TaxID=2022749 RepID=UPI003569A059